MVPKSGQCYEFGPFRLDVAEHMLLRNGQPVPLTPKIFAVLTVLVQNDGHLVEKDRLLKEVWPDSFVEEGTLNRSVSVLRKALGDSPSGHRYIETVPKRGYRFVARSPSVSTLNPASVISGTARLLSTPKLHTRIRSRFWRGLWLRPCVFAAQSERPWLPVCS